MTHPESAEKRQHHRTVRARYRRAVLKSAEDNHIWLNAFACVTPTMEFKAEVGALILEKLNDPDSLIDMEPIGTFTQKCLVLRINKS